jgi:replicative superfamily II helicase
LAFWLVAKYYISNYRPVLVEEHLVYENAVYAVCTSRRFFKTALDVDFQDLIRRAGKATTFQKNSTITASGAKQSSIEFSVALVNEIAKAGYGALIFCSSRAGCESDAILISQVMPESRKLPDEVLER